MTGWLAGWLAHKMRHHAQTNLGRGCAAAAARRSILRVVVGGDVGEIALRDKRRQPTTMPSGGRGGTTEREETRTHAAAVTHTHTCEWRHTRGCGAESSSSSAPSPPPPHIKRRAAIGRRRRRCRQILGAHISIGARTDVCCVVVVVVVSATSGARLGDETSAAATERGS